jgi:3-oxoacyl-[acyl-carrier protein] reductase
VTAVALVTGAARGIGFGIAARLLSDGYRVVLADVLESELDKAVADLGAGPDVVPVVADVTNLADLDRLVDVALAAGDFQVLVNNAGIQRDGRIEKLTERDWAEVVGVDLLAAARLTARITPTLKASRYGRIVNISSIFALGNFGQANYAAAKAGLIGLTKSVALELATYGVTANVICPGTIDTPGTAAFRERAPGAYDAFVNSVPMKRLGSAADIANAVAFFCLPESAYVTGQVLFVAGGFDLGVSRAGM